MPPILLSHALSQTTPAYGGGEGVHIEELSTIRGGATANSCKLTLPNHIGTHVDAPSHFFDGAPTLTDAPPAAWWFDRPVLIDVRLDRGGLVGAEWVDQVPDDAEIVLFRTGHEAVRNESEFWEGGFGLSAELGLRLREERPAVRGVGMDLISVTCRLAREEGRRAHRAFLDPDGVGDPILIVEDMHLSGCPPDLGSVLVSPLFLEALDGAPATVWGFPLPE